MEIKRGEVYMVELSPTKGSELKDPHPVVIVSTEAINKKSSVVIICPITDASGKNSPIHIPIEEGDGGLKKDSIVHCGQIRSIDKERIGKKLGELDRYKMAL